MLRNKPTSRKRRTFREPQHRPRVGERLVLEISDLTLEGDAVGRQGRYMLFVPGAIPGERVEVEVTSANERSGRARLVQVLFPSPARVQPRCRHFGECGGCSWQHIEYAEQLRWKERLLRATLEGQLPGVYLPVRPMIGATEPWGTRNKVHFMVDQERGRLVLGHYRAHSREVIPIQECPVHHETGNRVARGMLRLLQQHRIPPFAQRSHSGVARHVLVRVSGAGEAHAMLVASRPNCSGMTEIGTELIAAEPQVTGVHLNLNPTPGTVILGPSTKKLAGQKRLTEEIAGIKFLVSPTSFFQTSSASAARLVDTVLRYVPDTIAGPILDLYAGVGLFAAPLARRGHRVVAVEENPQAVEDGIETLKLNRIGGCRFLSGRVEAVLRKMARGESFEVVILDPPRDGCPEWVLRLVARQVRPARIIDVSCEPAALARDLALLTRCGYRVMEVQPIDMFPHTPHIESVAMLQHTTPHDAALAARRSVHAG